MGRFPQNDTDSLLAECHRCCCICHRFCGTKIETDHIVPCSEDGPDTIDNAIAVCFECHAEIHSYNDQHPRGRKFRPGELRKHKDQWLSVCKNNPKILMSTYRVDDVGPLQALLDELQFNLHVAKFSSPDELGCPFLNDQFRRAIQSGAIVILNEALRIDIIEAYRAVIRGNQLIEKSLAHPPGVILRGPAIGEATKALEYAKPKIEQAWKTLLMFLSSEK